MADKLTDADLVYVMQARREFKDMAEMSQAIGLSIRAIRERIAMAKSRNITADTKIVDPVKSAQIRIKILERTLAETQKHNDTAESIRREIYNIAERDANPPKWLTTKKGSGTPGTPMTIWSDWHYGEVVNPSEVGGLNEFNSKIAAERIKRLADRTVRLAKGFAFKEYGKDVKFPGIVVCLGGDMISGDIHEELADTNDRKPMECIDELVDLIAAALAQLADEFGKVFVPCVVGNHGRTTKKPRMKGRIITSYEWNLYCSLNRHFRNDPRIQFFIPNETDAYFEVAGIPFLLTHGDGLGVKGGDGIIGAIGPITRGVMKVMRSYEQIGKPIAKVIMGHWHQELWLPGSIVNNALKGYDEYARLMLRAPFDRPGQNLWFVHPEQGITARMQVYVDDLKNKPRKDTSWVKWAS